MGREAKILLAFLGLLAGVFVGVLSMKLLVPRPPTGAGPDIHPNAASAVASFSEPTMIVEPPPLTLPVAAFAAAPPLMFEGVPGTPPSDASPPPSEPLLTRTQPTFKAPHADEASGPTVFVAEAVAPGDDLLPPPAKFVLAPPARPINEIEPIASPGAPHDPFVARTNWQPPTPDPSSSTPRSMETAFPSPRQPLAGSHVAQTGDSWWSLAEAAYGDGRLYRALFAWNRALDPRVSLAAGTRLEVPPLAKLQAAWPRLVPAGEATAFDSGLSSAAP